MGKHEKSRTICLVIFLQVDKRVKVDVTGEVHVRPERHQMMEVSIMVRKRKHALDPPIIPEILY